MGGEASGDDGDGIGAADGDVGKRARPEPDLDRGEESGDCVEGVRVRWERLGPYRPFRWSGQLVGPIGPRGPLGRGVGFFYFSFSFSLKLISFILVGKNSFTKILN